MRRGRRRAENGKFTRNSCCQAEQVAPEANVGETVHRLGTRLVALRSVAPTRCAGAHFSRPHAKRGIGRRLRVVLSARQPCRQVPGQHRAWIQLPCVQTCLGCPPPWPRLNWEIRRCWPSQMSCAPGAAIGLSGGERSTGAGRATATRSALVVPVLHRLISRTGATALSRTRALVAPTVTGLTC